MDSSIFSDWFKLKFVPQCHKALKNRGLPDSAVLLVDNAPSHPDVDLLQSDEGKIFCVYLPPLTTSLSQPMDQGILENIKRRYKRDLLLWLLDDEVGSMNIAEFSKTLNIKDAVLMSAKSWSEAEASSIAKCWNKLLICSEDSNQDTEDAGDNVDINSILSEWKSLLEREVTGSELMRVTLVIMNIQKRRLFLLQGRKMKVNKMMMKTILRLFFLLSHMQWPAKQYRRYSHILSNSHLHRWEL